jgi:hypothetical protein
VEWTSIEYVHFDGPASLETGISDIAFSDKRTRVFSKIRDVYEDYMFSVRPFGNQPYRKTQTKPQKMSFKDRHKIYKISNFFEKLLLRSNQKTTTNSNENELDNGS